MHWHAGLNSSFVPTRQFSPSPAGKHPALNTLTKACAVRLRTPERERHPLKCPACRARACRVYRFGTVAAQWLWHGLVQPCQRTAWSDGKHRVLFQAFNKPLSLIQQAQAATEKGAFFPGVLAVRCAAPRCTNTGQCHRRATRPPAPAPGETLKPAPPERALEWFSRSGAGWTPRHDLAFCPVPDWPRGTTARKETLDDTAHPPAAACA